MTGAQPDVAWSVQTGLSAAGQAGIEAGVRVASYEV